MIVHHSVKGNVVFHLYRYFQILNQPLWVLVLFPTYSSNRQNMKLLLSGIITWYYTKPEDLYPETINTATYWKMERCQPVVAIQLLYFIWSMAVFSFLDYKWLLKTPLLNPWLSLQVLWSPYQAQGLQSVRSCCFLTKGITKFRKTFSLRHFFLECDASVSVISPISETF